MNYHEDYFNHRAEYGRFMMAKLIAQSNFDNSVVFKNEAVFILNGQINKYNSQH